jgi:hypothetical protein
MGKYNGAVVTTTGQALIANAIASNKKVTFTKLKASTHIYAASTNFEAMTSIADVVQSVDVSYVGVYGNNIVQTSGKFDNTGVATAFNINTIGLYGKVANGSETLIAIVTAINADTMPIADPNSPTSIVYNIQMTVQNSGALEAEINPAGTINVSQFNDALYSTALITVPTRGWSGSAPKFTRSIPVDGITSTSMPFVELKYPDDVTEVQKKAIDRAASKLVSLTTTNAGLVTLTATEVPETSFQLMLRGLGSGQYTPDQSDIIYSVITKQEPYVERVGIDGLAKMELVGGTVAWNQLSVNSNWTANSVSATYDSATDTINCTITKINNSNGIYRFLNGIKGRKILIDFEINPSDAVNVQFGGFEANTVTKQASANTWNKIKGIAVPGETEAIILYCRCKDAGWESGTISYRHINIFDLTQMFGTTIADYVYSLEQSTEGSGIAWLQSYGFFTKDYYAYDAGSLQNVCTSARKIIDLDGNERTYPIDDVQLRGLFKLDTNNKLYCDGDIYKSNGAVTRKYGIIDMGSMSWTYNDTYQRFNSGTLINVIKSKPNANMFNLFCIRYVTSASSIYDKKIWNGFNGQINLVDPDYTTASSLKTALSGVYLVYELATETTETADPYINPQRSLESGTEEFIDGLTRDVMVPVGNVTQYYQSEIIPIISEYIDAVMASN